MAYPWVVANRTFQRLRFSEYGEILITPNQAQGDDRIKQAKNQGGPDKAPLPLHQTRSRKECTHRHAEADDITRITLDAHHPPDGPGPRNIDGAIAYGGGQGDAGRSVALGQYKHQWQSERHNDCLNLNRSALVTGHH